MTEVEKAIKRVLEMGRLGISCTHTGDYAMAKKCFENALESVQFLIQQEGDK